MHQSQLPYPEPIQPKYLPKKRSIKFQPIGDKNYSLYSHKEFEKITSIKYLYHLQFDTKKTYNTIKSLCFKGIDKEKINKSAEWLGITYRKEVLNAQIADVVIKWVDNHTGFGLFAEEKLKKGSYIGEYVGVVRPITYLFSNVNPYCFRYPLYKIGYYIYTIDAQDCCNETSFINHSANPNAESIVTLNNDILHVSIRARIDIAKGEQITYDYGNYTEVISRIGS